MSADADVLVVGAGPAGSVAATLLARAGVRVRLVDRATFPRFKLCGDTLNPGGLALLRRLGLLTGDAGGLRVRGMTVTWHGSALRAAPAPAGKATAITGIYPDNLYGLAISRSRLDHALLDQAVAAGACFEPGVVVSDALLETRDDRSAVVGVRIASPGPARELRAGVTIAADGRRSRLAFGLGLSRHPPRPRRWAIGAYMHGVSGSASAGRDAHPCRRVHRCGAHACRGRERVRGGIHARGGAARSASRSCWTVSLPIRCCAIDSQARRSSLRRRSWDRSPSSRRDPLRTD